MGSYGVFVRASYFSVVFICFWSFSISSLYGEDVPAGVSRHRENAAKFVSENRADLAVGEHRQVVSDFRSSKYAVESQGEIVRLKIRGGDKAGALGELQKLLTDFGSAENLPMEIYSVAQEFKDSSASSQAMLLHRYNVSNSQISLGSMKSQGAIVANAFESKDYETAESELVKLKEVYGKTSGVAKEIHDLAQRYKAAGRGGDSVRWHKYNVSKYPDTFDGSVSQLEIVYNALDNNDYAMADQEVKFLTDNFGDRAGMSYGIYTVGKRFKEAGMPDKALAIHKLNAANASDMAGMLSQVMVFNESVERKEFQKAQAEEALLRSRFSIIAEFPQGLYKLARKYQDSGKPENAMRIYREVISDYPQAPEAVKAKAGIILDRFRTRDYAVADQELAELKREYKEGVDLSEELYQISEKYRSIGKYTEAVDNHRFNVRKNTQRYWASVSQIEIVDECFASGDYSAADREVQFLLDTYGKRAEMTYSMYDIGKQYKQAGMTDKAMTMFRRAMSNSHDTNAMWAQVEIIKEYLDRKDYAEAETQIDILCNKFNDIESLSKELYDLGCLYDSLDMPDKAMKYHQLNILKFPEDIYAISSQEEIVASSFVKSNFDETLSQCSNLYKQFSGKKLLFKNAVKLAERFAQKGDSQKQTALLKELKNSLQIKAASKNANERFVALADMAIVDIHLGDPNSAYNISNSLIDNYTDSFDNPVLGDDWPVTFIFIVGEECYLKANAKLTDNNGSEAKELYKYTTEILDRVLKMDHIAGFQSYDSCFMAAESFKRMGNISRAVEYYEKMLSYESSISDNTNLSAYYNLPQLYKTMSAKGQMSKAQYYRKSQDLYDLLASRYKNDTNIVKDAILRKCNISKKMKNWSDLSDSCDQYLEQFGMNDSAEVLYMLGQALVGKQQYAEAEDIFAECIDTAKEDTVLKGRVQLELESLKNLQ